MTTAFLWKTGVIPACHENDRACRRWHDRLESHESHHIRYGVASVFRVPAATQGELIVFVIFVVEIIIIVEIIVVIVIEFFIVEFFVIEFIEIVAVEIIEIIGVFVLEFFVFEFIAVVVFVVDVFVFVITRQLRCQFPSSEQGSGQPAGEAFFVEQHSGHGEKTSISYRVNGGGEPLARITPDPSWPECP
jgi:hypothetical protein